MRLTDLQLHANQGVDYGAVSNSKGSPKTIWMSHLWHAKIAARMLCFTQLSYTYRNGYKLPATGTTKLCSLDTQRDH